MKALPIWEIALPVNANNGHPYTSAHEKFRIGALEIAGGYTMRPYGNGMWRDAAGTVYADVMAPYRIACELPEFARIVEYAFRLFPDQLAIYTEHAGRAVIIPRGDIFNGGDTLRRSLACAYFPGG